MTDVVMPPINQPLIIELDGSLYKATLTKRNPERDVGRPLTFSGWKLDMEPGLWVAQPSIFDERWRPGMPNVGHGVQVLVLGKCRDVPTVPFICLDKNIPPMFPGFWNGPMTVFEGVIAWMPIEDLMKTAKKPPAELFELPTMSEVIQREKQRWMASFVEMAFMGVTNEAKVYHRLFEPLMNNRQVKTGRVQVSMRCWIERDKKENTAKANGLLTAVVYHVREWAFKNREDWQSPYSSIDKGSVEAAQNILEYYVREYSLIHSKAELV